VVPDETQRRAQWSEWNKKLLAKNKPAGLTIKSSRRSLGERMKVAFLDGDYRQVDANGRLDLDRTVETIRKARQLMDTVLQPEP
jgi:hypothetical protein